MSFENSASELGPPEPTTLPTILDGFQERAGARADISTDDLRQEAIIALYQATGRWAITETASIPGRAAADVESVLVDLTNPNPITSASLHLYRHPKGRDAEFLSVDSEVSAKSVDSVPIVYYTPIEKRPLSEAVAEEPFSLDPDNMNLSYPDWIKWYLGQLGEYLGERRTGINKDDFLWRKLQNTGLSPIAAAIHAKCELVVFESETRELRHARVKEGSVDEKQTLMILEELLKSIPGQRARNLADIREKLADMTGIYVPPELDLAELDTADFELRVSSVKGFHRLDKIADPVERINYWIDSHMAASKARAGTLGKGFTTIVE